MSALFNFNSFLSVVLLVICTCTYIKTQFPAILNDRTGFRGFFWKAARIGMLLVPLASCLLILLLDIVLIDHCLPHKTSFFFSLFIALDIVFSLKLYPKFFTEVHDATIVLLVHYCSILKHSSFSHYELILSPLSWKNVLIFFGSVLLVSCLCLKENGGKMMFLTFVVLFIAAWLKLFF